MMGPLKICVISKAFPPAAGGGETYAYELAKTLAERGHDVDVYTQWMDNPTESLDLPESVDVRRITKSRRKLAVFQTLWFSHTARRVVDFADYDIIHGTLVPASTIAVTPLKEFDTPIVLTSHGTSIGEVRSVALKTPADYLLKYFFNPINVVMDRVAGEAADAIIAISEHSQEQLIECYGFDAERVTIIPHGVDTDRFYPRKERHPAVKPAATTLLYVGRLGARKGLDLAIRALARIDDPDVEFLIAGIGRHEEHLRELVTEMDVADRVQFLGYVPDDELPTLYSSADAFVLPSRYEGFGLVLLEAMACGTPVIGTDVGGIPTAVKDGCGVTVERTVHALADAFTSVIRDQDDWNEMAARAAERANDSSWGTVAKDVEQVYENIIYDTRGQSNE